MSRPLSSLLGRGDQANLDVLTGETSRLSPLGTPDDW